MVRVDRNRPVESSLGIFTAPQPFKQIEVDFLSIKIETSHQLDLVTPIKSPWEAISRNVTRESLQKRYTPRPRPVAMHRFLNRVGDPFRFKLFSIWSDLNLIP